MLLFAEIVASGVLLQMVTPMPTSKIVVVYMGFAWCTAFAVMNTMTPNSPGSQLVANKEGRLWSANFIFY